jgi:glyoxylase-like metal-dependent hydrolase (beta-lactamase superfamily II)
VDVEELAPGLWRWTAWHEEWRDHVSCVYAELDEDVVLVDPLVPPEDADRFLRALDRDVERAGGSVHVLLTLFYHARSAKELAGRYGAEVWAPSRAGAAAERRAGPVKRFRPGDALPGGIEAFASGRPSEVVLLLPGGTLAVGDALLGGPLRLCPDSWVGKGGQAAVREALRPLAQLPVERVLTSHGEPVRTGGRAALQQLL